MKDRHHPADACEHRTAEVKQDARADRRAATIESTLVLATAFLFLSGLASQLLFGNVTALISNFFEDRPTLELLTTRPTVGPFSHIVLERGEIESSSNVEVRCEVSSRGSSGTNILQIVPEGTWVDEGDFLVRLDDAALQTQLIQQQIVCSNSQSAVIEAKANYDSAKLALDEYDKGTFKEQLEKQQSDVFVARENMRRAEEYLVYSKRLASRGYVPEAQLEADAFAVEKARKELKVAETKLEVMQTYTRQKMLTQLNADIETAKARLQSKEKTWELDKIQLRQIEDQIAKCTITAPCSGQVVYQNKQSRSSSTVLIEEGLPVRERQVIINLPDPTKMRVIAKVHESRIGHVRPGLPAKLLLDAMPETELSGHVTQVSEYPLPAVSAYMDHVKEYEVAIEIDSPPKGLRPGMTAEVRVLVDEIDRALQLPIEAVTEDEGRFFCGIPTADGGLSALEIQVGQANETAVIVKEGLREGAPVVLNVTDPDVAEELSAAIANL
ncbi:HlyD family efflux transporter periplasmic adaptor subunit [Roseiconus nitratireducens]|uniref:HlyD family efflux transporter periplasmic adaptor subunit n=1 Tax=Roseiconus nitratireducens TaxID=2605748 RepID=A0A5M6DF33_9BACT|nr:HlyD family efflux transporter periplasmic adaptor subunit [Roseiconus nitratireducens]KAA5543805.1 HlyD family efflux transporter periplasmic adaptor subunit [Roseiconus nitratireducens]